MPTYAYRCTECGTAFDVQQAFTDASLTECPNCGGRLRKVFGSVGVTFNGSGFYRTDSRAGGKRESGSSEPAKTASGSGTSESTSSSASSGSGSSGSGSSGSSSASSSSASGSSGAD